MRIGIGYDIHRLVEGRPMMIGGIEVPYFKGTLGHSDGDPLLHAVCDAILGALGTGDIGTFFPDSDPGYKGISSRTLLSKVVEIMEERSMGVSNLDAVVIAEGPRIAPHRADIISSLAKMLKISPDRINVKGKTAEGMGPAGEGRAIEAHVAVLLSKMNNSAREDGEDV